MKKTHFIISKILAIPGTILVILPVLAPIFFALIRIFRTGFTMFNFDYLMPAELFLIAFVGGLLLIAASIMARSYRAVIIGGFVSAVIFLAGGQWFAVVTGIASGETNPSGLIWTLILLTIAIYTVSLIEMGICGILLAKKLFKTS